MQAKLKSIVSTELAGMELPPDPADCEIAFELEVGPEETDEGELFGFTVITVQRLEQSGLPCWGRGLLIVDIFSWSEVAQMLSQIIANSNRETWGECAIELRKYLSLPPRSTTVS